MQLVRIGADYIDLERIPCWFSYPAYLHYPNRAGLPQFIAERVRRALGQEWSLGLVASVNDEQIGLMGAYRATWDSDKLGVSMAKADILVDAGHPSSPLVVVEFLRAFDGWATELRVRHVAIRLNFEDIVVRVKVENMGFHIVDALLVQKLELTSPVPKSERMVSCRSGALEDAAAFEEDVAALYADSRYHVDGGFELQRLRNLYALWLRTAFASEADRILVAELDGRPVGFITCYIEQEYTTCTDLKLGFIGLLGVLPSAQGRKVGKSLIQGAVEWFDAQGIQVVTVATQITNYAGLSTYQSSGFRPLTALATYHCWRSDK